MRNSAEKSYLLPGVLFLTYCWWW